MVKTTDANWSRLVNTLKKAQDICASDIVIKLNVPYENILFQVDFYRAFDNNFGIQELIRAGSADHNMWLAGYSISKGYRVVGRTEESVFSALGLPCPIPEEHEIVNCIPVWIRD